MYSKVTFSTPINGNGYIKVEMTTEPLRELMYLPRVGMTLQMPEGFEEVSWYGRGPHESYVDKKESALVDVYVSTVDELYEAYNSPTRKW